MMTPSEMIPLSNCDVVPRFLTRASTVRYRAVVPVHGKAARQILISLMPAPSGSDEPSSVTDTDETVSVTTMLAGGIHWRKSLCAPLYPSPGSLHDSVRSAPPELAALYEPHAIAVALRMELITSHGLSYE